MTKRLPPPTELWMGDLHRLFNPSPAEIQNAVLRARIADLEAQNRQLAQNNPFDALPEFGTLLIKHRRKGSFRRFLSRLRVQADRDVMS